MTTFSIGERPVGEGVRTYVIAEAGSNHNGEMKIAKRLIDNAAEAGADAVKFQVFRAEHVYVEDSGPVEYFGDDRPIYDVISDLEVPYEWVPELSAYCARRSVDFLASATDQGSVDAIADHVPAFKVPSYTLTHYRLLDHIASKGLPIIMSTGAHTFEESTDAVEYVQETGVSDLAVLHCVAAYPTPLDSINVRVVERLQNELGVVSGLSDHTLDPVTAPCAAVALGGSVIEKHFTLDRSMEGPDHSASLEPDELERMIDSIRVTETALGSCERPIYDVESELHDIARRRIHATEDIAPGERLTEENTAVLRSGRQFNGLDPREYDAILGTHAAIRIGRGQGITWNDVE